MRSNIANQADAAEPALPGRWGRPLGAEAGRIGSGGPDAPAEGPSHWLGAVCKTAAEAASGGHFNLPGSLTDLIVANSMFQS